MSLVRNEASREEPDVSAMSTFCATEEWYGDLETGLLRVGMMTRQILDLQGGSEQGLLSLLQRFDPADHGEMIDEFERAASEPTRFSFATKVVGGSTPGQAVFCIGRSSVRGSYGAIEGIFIFTHL
jgi:hypothetical protein